MSSSKAVSHGDRHRDARDVKASTFVDEAPLPFACVLAWSALLHVFAAGELRGAPRGRAVPRETVIALLAPEPPPPPIAPIAPEATPAPAPSPARPLRATSSPSPRAPAPPTVPAFTPPIAAADDASDVPVDFTRAVLTSVVAGAAVGNGSAGAPAIARAPSPATLPAVRHVPAADLARLPRPPLLDDALERFYPESARNAGIAGSAVLRVEILADGKVGDVRPVTESRAGFARACESAVRSGQWGAPADRAGVPVATFVTYTCRFEVRS